MNTTHASEPSLVDDSHFQPTATSLNLLTSDTELVTGKILYQDQTPQPSKSYLQKGAEQQYNLGIELQKAALYEQALPLFITAAELGHAAAQAEVAHAYYHGYGIAEDHQQAVYWYRKAAEQGLAYAQLRLCLLYDDGDGVIQDKQQARYWCSRAAIQGNSMAKDMLAVL